MVKNYWRYLLMLLLIGGLGLLESAQAANPPLQIVDVTQFVELERLGRGTMYDIGLSPDGKTLAVASSIGIWLYDIETLESIRFIEGHTDVVSSVAWSPDGQMVASGSADTTIRLWDAEQGTELAVLTGHTDDVTTLAFSPDGQTLASGSEDTTVRLWDTRNETEQATLFGHTDTVNSVAWSPDGTRLASAGDKTVRVWDRETERELFILSEDSSYDMIEEMTDIAWLPDGSQIVAVTNTPGGGSDGLLLIWNAATGENADSVITPLSSTNTIAWQPGNQKLAIGGTDYFFQIFGTKIIDLENLDRAITFSDDFLDSGRAEVLSVLWTPDGKKLITLEVNSTIRMWDFETYTALRTIEHRMIWPDWALSSRTYRGGHGSPYVSSPDGRYATVADIDGGFWIEETETGNVLRYIDHELSGGGAYPTPYVAWSPDNRYLALDFSDHTVSIFARENWEPAIWLDLGTDRLIDMAWSPDSKLLVIASNGSLRIWDIESNEEVINEEFPGTVGSILWSPDGSYFTFVQTIRDTGDYLIHLWNIERAEDIVIFEATHIGDIKWSPDGSVLAISSKRTISLFDTDHMNETEDVTPSILLQVDQGTLGYLGWSTDGTRLVSGSWDGTVYVWGIREN